MSSAQAGHVGFHFEIEGVSQDEFSVVEFSGHEAMNEDFSFRILLISKKSDLEPSRFLHRRATFRIESRREGEQSRSPYHGLIGEFRVRHQVTPYTYYEALLVPRFHQLALSNFSEVYTLEKGIPEILEDVLKDYGLSTEDYQFRLGESYRPRSFICQFAESSHTFVDRWVEREGIAYYFDQEGEKERIVFYDQPHQKPSWNRTLQYRPPGELDVGLSNDSLQEWVQTASLVPSRLVVQNFNYRKANLNIEESEVLDSRGKGTVQSYGGNLRTNAEAKKQATLLSETLKAGMKIFEGKCTATGIRAATTIHVKSHFQSEHNGSFFVTSVRHQGTQAAFLLSGVDPQSTGEQRQTHYEAVFSAIPSDVHFRPQRKTPWPRVPGVVTAVIDAEGSGKFAELNEYGEYKLAFSFVLQKKRPQKGSGWVRLATPLAGEDNGIHFPIHKNTEVLVSFVNGDPDQPVIVGALHNSESRNLISNMNPEKNIIRSAGGHFLMFNDGNL
jgi:type VI secretion system secreted protein VgrG